jgi:predicted RNase H-like HicB family nuclease
MQIAASKNKKSKRIFSKPTFLSIYILKDEDRFMAKCVELDLITEMDTKEEAFESMIEMIKEYAEDYQKRIHIFEKSPNRFHHKPYIDMVSKCKDDWELFELIEVKYGHLQL